MMVLDKEADVEVNQEVDKEVTKVVEVDKELVNEGLALACRYGDSRRGDHKVTVVVVVLDKEADVGVNQEVDKEVTKVVEEFCLEAVMHSIRPHGIDPIIPSYHLLPKRRSFPNSHALAD